MAIASRMAKTRNGALPKVPVEQKPKSKKKFSLMSFLFYALLVLVGSFFLFNIGKSVYESVVLFQENRSLEAKVDNLYYEKQLLLEKEQGALVDAEIEKKAKDNLGLLKPGEEVIVLENNK